MRKATLRLLSHCRAHSWRYAAPLTMMRGLEKLENVGITFSTTAIREKRHFVRKDDLRFRLPRWRITPTPCMSWKLLLSNTFKVRAPFHTNTSTHWQPFPPYYYHSHAFELPRPFQRSHLHLLQQPSASDVWTGLAPTLPASPCHLRHASFRTAVPFCIEAPHGSNASLRLRQALTSSAHVKL